MNNIQTLTVYLGSSGHCRTVFKDSAMEMGRLIGHHEKKLAYGGMDAGLMGLLAKAALEAGAHVTGVIPKKLQDSERILGGLSETILVEELCDRKKEMFLMADAVVALPGGFGTLDESLEVLYCGALGLHDKPLVLVNIENYWDDAITYLTPLPDFDERFLIIVDHVSDVIPALEDWGAFSTPIEPPHHLPHFEDEITRDTDEPILIDKASVENTYLAICALGLRQLAKHNRAIGFLNTRRQFDALERWIKTAARETFVTEKCLDLYVLHEDEGTLRTLLKKNHTLAINIDLHNEKWGPRD